MTTPSGVDTDAPTLIDIDQALEHLRLSVRQLDGDEAKQAVVYGFADDLLDQRLEMTRG